MSEAKAPDRRPRLAASTLDAVRTVSPPAYDRSGPAPYVHLGPGAFARAHLGVYADDLLIAGHPARVRAVALRHGTAERQLGPQDGLYTVTTREPSAAPVTRIVGSFASVATGAEAAVAAVADPTTTLVTLTVTEHGYETTGPGSAAEVLALGLEARRVAGHGGLVIASLDNLLDNGRVLRDQVLAVAADTGPPGLPEWIEARVAFPGSVVDRMVPAPTDADRVEVAERLGLVDEAAVVAEAHRSWVVEAVDGLPPLAAADVEVVAGVGAHQQRKLWLLNAPHSALAYGGLLVGHDTIAAAVADPLVAGFVRRLVDDVLAVVDPTDGGPEPVGYAEDSLRRFANPALGHTCTQVGADGSRKLAQRVLPVVEARRVRDLPVDRFAVVVAAWLAAVTGTPVQGRPLAAVEDPAAGELRAALGASGPIAAAESAVGSALASWAPDVAAALDQLVEAGAGVLESTP
ncbi:MAG TPA: mannitol dehydrogenase family protein [Acidimicrobiales bacterium]|nr:mannitol dehydrogenase family protein [Acidimicrobiales bacterium]